MERAKAKADLPAEMSEGTVDPAAEASVATAPATSAPYQELLVSWWTTTALAWGTPVRMWSEIVAAAWRPFLPPTALTPSGREPPCGTDPARRRAGSGTAGAAGGEADAARGCPDAAGAAQDATATLETCRRFEGAARPSCPWGGTRLRWPASKCRLRRVATLRGLLRWSEPIPGH